jgi:alpha-tubulin suppressor-like RCC1 family protein
MFSCVGNRCVKVGAGDGFSVFLTEEGDVYTCGEGNYGRLGHYHGVSMSKPTVIDYFRK